MAASTLEDFTLVKTLGKASIGKAILVQHTSGSFYALKVMAKDTVCKRGQIAHVSDERKTLEFTNHPFIVGFHYASQIPKQLFLVMEFCQGGDLYNAIATSRDVPKKARFTEERSKFCASELVLAIEYIHSMEIIHRHITANNVCLDKEGHIKLIDFGLCKMGITDNISAVTVCGEPEYMAPEVLDKKGHGRAVDWYSLGCLTYEMITGLPPFYTRDHNKLFAAIRKHELTFPDHVSEQPMSFMDALLRVDPDTRLGGTGGAEEVKADPFFGGCNWEEVFNRGIESPFKMDLNSEDDTRYFDREHTDINTAIDYPNADGVECHHFPEWEYSFQ